MRLIVVDDDRLVVDSLKIILGAQPQIEVVGTGADGDVGCMLGVERHRVVAVGSVGAGHGWQARARGQGDRGCRL